jgi:hypothetical protein
VLAEGGPAVTTEPFPSWPEALSIGALLTLWSLLFRGFEGGRWSDIPIFKSFVDPRLYVNDPFVYSLHDGTPAAYTYRFVAAVVGLLAPLPLEWALFVLFVPASVMSLALLYLIARQLGADRVGATLFLLLYVSGFRLLTVGSTILGSAELTPAFLALPLQLGALLAFLRERHALAGALAGLAVVVHTPTSSYVGLAIGLAYLLRVRHYGLKNVGIAGLAMVICSAPAIVGALQQHTDALPGWALQLARIELATDISVAVNWSRSALLLYNLVGVLLLAATVLLLGSWRRIDPAVLALFGATLILCAVAYVFIDLTLRGTISTLVARLQLPRGVWIVNLLGLVYVARALRDAWVTQQIPRVLLLVLLGAMLVSPSDFVPLEPIWVAGTLLLLIAAAVDRWLPARRREAGIALSALAVLAVIAVGAGRLAGRRFWQFDLDDGARAAALVGVLLVVWGLAHLGRRVVPAKVALGAAMAVALTGAFVVRGSTDWLYQLNHRGGLASAAQFQEWARTQTPVDSVFLILPSDPNNDTFYMNADRALFLARERANQAVYFREHNLEFRDRVLALGVSDVLRYREELDPMYRRLTEDRVRDLAARFKVNYFVPARAGDYSFPIVYQQGAWTVYEVGRGEYAADELRVRR